MITMDHYFWQDDVQIIFVCFLEEFSLNNKTVKMSKPVNTGCFH